ncbi:hypothetical protein GGI07_002269 [Coemansia sp. Benny D115]|nr:hypothetical protein GGI07_002269 [Coemansia sp. Benny D115]
MSLKAELEQWDQAVELFDAGQFERSRELFAIDAYSNALELDNYLVVAYFQRGVAKMVLKMNKEALSDFNSALKYLRDNEFIDYTQIGLDYKVYTCEVLYNRALCFFCMNKEKEAHADLTAANSHRVEERHSWIKRAAESNGMDCPLYCVPKGVIYRPSASKLKSSKKIDFLGSAKVIASADGTDNFTGFKGALVRKETLRNANGGGGSGLSPSGMTHQKSMRIKRSTPPPETTGALARSNTMPANRHDSGPSSLPMRMAPSSLQREISGSGPLGHHPRGPPNGGGGAPHSYQGQPERPRVDLQLSESEHDDASETTSSAFTSPTTATTNNSDALSPDYGGERLNGLGQSMPKSAMKKSPSQSPVSRSHVDPLDIIRAGLARRATLKNQNQQNQRSDMRSNMPQRSVTLKLPARGGRHDDDNGYDDEEEDDDDDYEDNGENGYDGHNPAKGSNGNPSSRMRLNPSQLRGNPGGAPVHPGVAQVARNEMITPVIQRSNTDGGIQNMQIDYSGMGSGGYHGNNGRRGESDHSSMPNNSGISSSLPHHNHHHQHHPNLSSGQQSHNPVMMTPPLNHEEVATRGLAAMSVQNTHMPYASAQGHIQTYAPSSGASSPSPSIVSPGSGGQYSTIGGPVGGGLRRAPTKKDAMKVKVHYGTEIINLMVPKTASFDVLRAKIDAKIASATSNGSNLAGLRIRYMDEDGEAVLMTDEDDFELAKAYAGGDMTMDQANVVERLELWCSMA